MVGGHPPVGVSADEDISGVGAEVICPTLYHASDYLYTRDITEVALDHHVQITNVKLHHVGGIEDAFPTLADRLPSHQRLPPGMDAKSPVGMLPDIIHTLYAEFVESVVEPLVGGS